MKEAQAKVAEFHERHNDESVVLQDAAQETSANSILWVSDSYEPPQLHEILTAARVKV